MARNRAPKIKKGTYLERYATGASAEVVGFSNKGGIRKARIQHSRTGKVTASTLEAISKNYRVFA